jgi:sugar lactone lactonase YvrE
MRLHFLLRFPVVASYAHLPFVPLIGFFLCVGSIPTAAQTVTFEGAQFTLQTNGVAGPDGIVVDRAGDVFIADFDHNRVVELPANGNAQITVGSGLSLPIGLALDAANDLFIADSGHNRIVEVPAAGGTQVTLGFSNLSRPTSVAVDAAGDVFVTDFYHNRIVELPVGGAQTTVADGFNQPFGVALDSSNDLFVADFGNDRVVEIPAGCTMTACQIIVASGLTDPSAVAVDPARNLLISTATNAVEVPAEGGPAITLIQGVNSTGITADHSGNVFVSDTSHNRVLKLERVAVDFGSVNLCAPGKSTPAPCAETLTLNYEVAASGKLGTPKVVTQGTPNLDFTLASGSTCHGTVTEGSTCQIDVTFAPRFAGERPGAVQVADQAGNILATTLIHGFGDGPQLVFPQHAPEVMATGLYYPAELALDGAGNLFLADEDNMRVVELPAGGGPLIEVLGSVGFFPSGLALDGAGRLYISEIFDDAVIELTPGKSDITEIPFTGLNQPAGIAVDSDGNLFLADSQNNQVLELPATGGPQITVTKNVHTPENVAVDPFGNVYIADYGGEYNRPRVVEVPARGGAQFTVKTPGYLGPDSVATDGVGDLFCAELQQEPLFELPIEGGPPINDSFDLTFLLSVAVDPGGNIFVGNAFGTDTGRLFELRRSEAPTLKFGNIAFGSTATLPLTLSNTGTTTLTIEPSIDGPSYKVTGSTCASGIPPGSTCQLKIEFSPVSVGYHHDTMTLHSNGVTDPPVLLRGTAD